MANFILKALLFYASITYGGKNSKRGFLMQEQHLPEAPWRKVLEYLLGQPLGVSKLERLKEISFILAESRLKIRE